MNRDGVMLLLYDLPTQTSVEKRKYARFCKQIKKMGFASMQKSVYFKYLAERESRLRLVNELQVISPKGAQVLAFVFSMSQFCARIVICGDDIVGEQLDKVVIL